MLYPILHLHSPDIWITSGQNVKPEIGDKFRWVFSNFASDVISFSAETYYRRYAKQIDLKKRADIFANEQSMVNCFLA
jgi:hypothetical protein